MVERELRPIYGPWRIYTREEEEDQIRESLARQNKFNRDWEDGRNDSCDKDLREKGKYAGSQHV